MIILILKLLFESKWMSLIEFFSFTDSNLRQLGKNTRFGQTSTKHCLNQHVADPAGSSAFHESAFQSLNKTQSKANQPIFQAYVHNHMPPNLQNDWGIYTKPRIRETREQRAKRMQQERARKKLYT